MQKKKRALPKFIPPPTLRLEDGGILSARLLKSTDKGTLDERKTAVRRAPEMLVELAAA